jgi:hypothetical protein
MLHAQLFRSSAWVKIHPATTMARWEDKNFKDFSVLMKIRRNFWLTGQYFRL